jgi:hypothetical protein
MMIRRRRRRRRRRRSRRRRGRTRLLFETQVKNVTLGHEA